MVAQVEFADHLRRIPMSREEFDALPEGPTAEYVDGIAIVSPPSDVEHGYAKDELRAQVKAGLPGTLVVTESGIELAHSLRVPDLVVMERFANAVWSTQTPILVAEVLSRSTRREDTLRKSVEYAAAGIAFYLVVDREPWSLTALSNSRGGWDIVLVLDEESPTGSLQVGEFGTVEFDLRALMPPRD